LPPDLAATLDRQLGSTCGGIAPSALA